MALTYEQVAEAAERMTARGEVPTLRSARAELGSGSQGTIQKHLARWRVDREASRHSGTMPSPELLAQIRKEIAQAEERADNTLRQNLDLARKELDEMGEDNEAKDQRLAELERLLEEQRTLCHRQTGRIGQLENQLAALQHQEEEARKTRDMLLGSLAKAEVRLEALDPLKAEREELRDQRDREKDARIKAEKEAAVAEALLKRISPSNPKTGKISP